MEKKMVCNCEDSPGNTTVRCCNACGLSVEPFWYGVMDFKKFSLLEDIPTTATDNTPPLPDNSLSVEEMQSTDKFKQYLNSIINTIPGEIHNELWNHLLAVISDQGTINVWKNIAAQERNRAIQECQDIVQKFDFENESDFWCLCELEKLKTP